MSGIFDRLGQGQQAQRQITPGMMQAELGNLKANPGAYLSRQGFNIPSGMSDPRQITQYLLQSGQVGSGKLQQVMQFLRR